MKVFKRITTMENMQNEAPNQVYGYLKVDNSIKWKVKSEGKDIELYVQSR